MLTLARGTKITIGGLCGTGKGATSEILAKLLDYDLMSAGKYFRAIADEMGISLKRLEDLAIGDSQYDIRVDRETEAYGRTHNFFVFEGRLAWYKIPKAVAIRLTCDFDVRVDRLSKREDISFEQAKADTIHREASAKERYKNLYDISDITDLSHYWFSVDTTKNTAEEVVEKIVAKLKNLGLYRPLKK